MPAWFDVTTPGNASDRIGLDATRALCAIYFLYFLYFYILFIILLLPQ
jgi:hypothetical protein